MGSCFTSCVRAASSDSSKSSDQSASRSDGRYAASIAASFVPIDGPLTPLSRPRSPQHTPTSGHIDRPPADADDPKSASSSTRSNDDSGHSRCSWDSESSSSGRTNSASSSAINNNGFELMHPPSTPTRRSPLATDKSGDSDSFNNRGSSGGLHSVPISDRSSSSDLQGVLPKQQLPNCVSNSNSSDDIGVPLYRPAAVAATNDWNEDNSNSNSNNNEPSSRRSSNGFMLGDEIAMDLPDSETDGRGYQWLLAPRNVLPPIPPTQALPPDSKNSSTTSNNSSSGGLASRAAYNKSGTLAFVGDVVLHGSDSRNSSGGNSYASSLSNSAGSAQRVSSVDRNDDDDDDDDDVPPHAIRNTATPDLVTPVASRDQSFAGSSTSTLGPDGGGGIERDPSWQVAAAMSNSASSTRSSVSGETVAFAESGQVSPRASLSLSGDLHTVEFDSHQH